MNKVPKNDPVLLAANHQNALIDALNVVNSCDKYRQTTFLTRSDVFNHRFKPIMLNYLKMLPVYRQRDGGVDALKKNEEIFQICVDRLSRDDVVLIFPEGNHDRKQRIRPLKKGVARIGFQAAEENKFDLTLSIVPVGLNYENHLKFDTDLLVMFGPPIHLSEYYDAFQENPQKALTDVIKRLRKEMAKLVLHISSPAQHELINGLREIFVGEIAAEKGIHPRDLRGRLHAGQELISKVEKHLKEHANEEESEKLLHQLQSYQDGLKNLRLRDHVIANGPFSLAALIGSVVPFLIGLPLHLIGVIGNYLPYKLSEFLAKRFFKDDHFHTSIMAVSGMFHYPLWMALIWGIVGGISGSWLIGLLTAICMPLLGKFSMLWLGEFKRWWGKWRYFFMKRKGNPRLQQLIELRGAMGEWLRGVLEEKVTMKK